MFCQNCGNKVSDGAAFCGTCGAKIEPLEEQAVVYAEPIPTLAKKKTPLKIIIPVVIAAVLVIAAIPVVLIAVLKADTNKTEVAEEEIQTWEYEEETEYVNGYYTQEFFTEEVSEDLTEEITEELTEEAEIEQITEPQGTVTAEDIINVFMDNKYEWMLDDEYGGYHDGQSWYYGFIDIDFDGIPELVSGGVDGSGRYTSFAFYKINSDFDGIEKIEHSGEEYEELDIVSSAESLELYRVNSSGEMMFWSLDYESAGAFGNYTSYGTFECNGNRITEEYYFFEANEYYEGETFSTYSIKKNDGMIYEVSEDEYNDAMDDFFAERTDLNLTVDYVSDAEFKELSKSEQKERLQTSLESFGYDGYEPQY